MGNKYHVLPLLLLAIFCCACMAESSDGKDATAKDTTAKKEKVNDKTLRNASMDQVIAQLPEVGNEGKWNEQKKEYVYYPAVREIQRRLAEGKDLTDAQWRKLLLKTGAIRLRKRWPKDRPLAISMRKPGWLGVAEIRMKPRAKGLKSAKAGTLIDSSCGTYTMAIHRAALCQHLGKLPLGKHKIIFDVVVERGEERSPFRFNEKEDQEKKPAIPSGILWGGEMSFDVEIVESDDNCVAPVKNEDVDRAVRNSLGVAFNEWYINDAMRQTAIFVIDPDLKDYPVLADMALSLKIEILHQGHVVEERNLMASAYDPIALAISVSKGDRKSIGFCLLKEVPAELKDKKSDRKDWSVRVTGTSNNVVYLWDARRRWSGTVEMPIEELIEREKKRTGGKKRIWMYSGTFR